MKTKVPMQSQDDMLLEQMRKADRMAFEKIYYKYSPALYYSAYNLLRDRQTCEDLVQELFTDLWIKRNRLNIRSLNAYLYKATRNRVLMVIRSGKAQIDPLALEMLAGRYAADDALAEKDLKRILNKEIAGLPDRCRQIFTLSRHEQLSNKEIASRLNISVKTVENQITIALRSLRASLGDVLPWIGILLLGYV